MDRREKLIDAIKGATLPAIELLAGEAAYGATVRHDRDEYVRKLSAREAMVREKSALEERKQAASKMPAHLQVGGGRPRALWMLDHCEWNDPAMQQLLAELEVYVGPLRLAKQTAERAVSSVPDMLDAAAILMPDDLVGRWAEAMHPLGPCVSAGELPSMRFAGRWLDTVLRFPAHMGPPLTVFSADAVTTWLDRLPPEATVAGWLHDGASFPRSVVDKKSRT